MNRNLDCGLCGKTFTFSQNLGRHLRNQHGQNKDNNEYESPIEIEAESESPMDDPELSDTLTILFDTINKIEKRLKMGWYATEPDGSSKMSNSVDKINFLKKFRQATPDQCRKILRAASKGEIRALHDCLHSIKHGYVPLSRHQIRRINKVPELDNALKCRKVAAMREGFQNGAGFLPLLVRTILPHLQEVGRNS
jgi:hypothetical protein